MNDYRPLEAGQVWYPATTASAPRKISVVNEVKVMYHHLDDRERTCTPRAFQRWINRWRATVEAPAPVRPNHDVLTGTE